MSELGYDFDVPSLAAKLEVAQTDPRTKGFVAEENGKIVGFASLSIMPLFHEQGAIGRITALVVTRDSRAHGIGKQLVDAAEQYAWEHGCSRMEVTSADHRKTAHDFYESIDYSVELRRFTKKRPESI